MNVPYDSDQLLFANDASTGNAAASPFVVAIKIAKIPNLPGILNAGFLVFTFSAANSDLYIATRTLYGLAGEGKAPAFLRYKNKNKIPVIALAVCSAIACIAFMSVKSSSTKVFKYFVNMVSMFGLLTWISVLVTHIYFVRARKAQGVANSSMAYTAPFGVVGSYIALVSCCVIALTKNFDVFVGTFDYEDFITGYLGIPIYIALFVGYKIVKRPKGVKPEEADLWSGKAKIDAEEQEFIAQEAQIKEEKRGKGGLTGNMYRFVSWLF